MVIHQFPPAPTVADLRKALSTLPDSAPVHIAGVRRWMKLTTWVHDPRGVTLGVEPTTEPKPLGGTIV